MPEKGILTDDSIKLLEAHIDIVQVPNANSYVEKDECALSFDTPHSPTGLYTNLRTWLSYSKDFVLQDSKRTNVSLYLYQKHYKIHKNKDKLNDNNNEITKVGIGIESGFSIDDEYEIIKENYLCILPEFKNINLNNDKIPKKIILCCNEIIKHKGVAAIDEIKSWEDDIKESKWSDKLPQLEASTDKRPSPNKEDWKCESCGKSFNLWFNLSDGYIGCGRKQYGSEDSCGAAVEHYKNTNKKYPLSVKLGTLNKNGGDIWSYDEDNMVKNKNLAKHLSHWGIDIMKQQKTEKTITELTVQRNKDYSFGLVVEQGVELVNVRDKELIGLDNLGNSCYMNSVLQTIFSINEIKNKYYPKNYKEILFGSNINDPTRDFVTQMTKLANGLLSNEYIEKQDKSDKINIEMEKNKKIVVKKDDKKKEGVKCVSVKPRMFRKLVGKNHIDFSTNKQQDAVEYFRHILDFIYKSERVSKILNNKIDTLQDLFKFKIEERLECQQSKKVKYTNTNDIILPLNINLNDAVNQNIVNEWKKKEKQRIIDQAKKLELEAAKKKKESETSMDVDTTTNKETTENTDKSDKTKDNNDKTDKNNDKTTKKEDSMDIETTKNKNKTTTNKNDEKKEIDEKKEEKIVPIIPFEKCLSGYLGESIADNWLSPETNKKGKVKKSFKLVTFPKYLAIKIQRYYIDAAWTPQKYDVEVPVPENIDITALRGNGLQKNEVELPSDKPVQKSNKMEAKQDIVDMLVGTGMATKNAAIRAALAVQNANAEMAMNWLMDHMGDADINDPIKDDTNDNNGGTNDKFVVDKNQAATLAMTMGFTTEQCVVALTHTKGDQARAVDWLFSHEADLDNEVSKLKNEIEADKKIKNKELTDGKGKYTLFSIISHQGSDTGGGHYVAHIKKNNKWYFFNDNKVAISQKTPFKYGYLYIFQRNDTILNKQKNDNVIKKNDDNDNDKDKKKDDKDVDKDKDVQMDNN